jgi:hypothetical protein
VAHAFILAPSGTASPAREVTVTPRCTRDHDTHDVDVRELGFEKVPDGYGGMRRYLWEIGVCRGCGREQKRRWQVRGHPTEWEAANVARQRESA